MIFKRPLKGNPWDFPARVFRSYSAPSGGGIPEAKRKYVPTEGHYPQGFKAGSTHVGVKASNTRFDDLALITSDTPCAAAAVFTRNRFQAAPVQVSRSILNKRNSQGISAVIVNSGCANAVTGRGGLDDAHKMAQETDRCLVDLSTAENDIDTPRSLVMSTGVIGQRLPIDKITQKIPAAVSALGSTHDHWLAAARAICTTDTFPKLATREFSLPDYPGQTFRMAGMTKGAGMIHPNMGTLLGVICTDAPVIPSFLHPLLTRAVATSFNSISIDGDTSTNDTIALLANGAAVANAGAASPPADIDQPHYQTLQAELSALCAQLAQLVVRDGEGATKFVTIRVRPSPGATSEKDVEGARRIASCIARSPLVKTALYGRDANWGRILCAIGYAEGVPEGVLDPTACSVSFVQRDAQGKMTDELELLLNGEPKNVDEAKASRFLAEEDLEILVRLTMRVEEGEEYLEDDVLFWTCDLSHEYVTINGDYRT